MQSTDIKNYRAVKAGRPGSCRHWSLTVLLLAVSVFIAAWPAHAQGRKSIQTQPPSERKLLTAPLIQSRDEFVKTTNEYKASLAKLLSLYEGNVREAEDRATLSKELYDRGLISRREADERQRVLSGFRDKADEVRQQLKLADQQIADVFVESLADEQSAKSQQPTPVNRSVVTKSYLRYNGSSGWSLADAGRVQRFFRERFGRPLPVSAYGQSALHDRWGLDHRAAMDVGLNPDSVEGQALVAYLRASGIPFTAFRHAIAGSATGPHIHVGRPSHRNLYR
jgi:hypothetical protein